MNTISAPVLVVGAGPVGLSAALLLARKGIECVLIERRATRDPHPKARGVRIRTMELFRQWGLEPELRANALPPEARRFIYCDSLAGQELGRSAPVGDGEDEFSPTTTCRVAQDSVERALLRRVQAEPSIELSSGTALESLEQDGDGVTARLTLEDGSEWALRAEYVIAADGVASTTRRILGIEMEGPAVLAYWQSVYWRGDISRWTSDRPCIQFMTGAKAGDVATVASVDGRDRWVTMVTRKPSAEQPSPLSADEARTIVRRAVGSEVDVEVIDTATWRLSAQVAARWQVGRIFLAGDAAHSFPPTGGFGMNTGVQDAHNLVWKLAVVLQGRASARLLETYTPERKPVARANADWSVANSGRFRDIAAAIVAEDQPRLDQLLLDQKEHVHALTQDLGFSYTSPAVIPDAGGPAPAAAGFVPSAAPGRRAPHAWIVRDGVTVSTLDLFDSDFVLIAGPDGSAWCKAAAAVDGTVPRVVSYQVGIDLTVEETFEPAYQLGHDGAVLVRPDGHVAWRANTLPDDPSKCLTDVMIELTG